MINSGNRRYPVCHQSRQNKDCSCPDIEGGDGHARQDGRTTDDRPVRIKHLGIGPHPLKFLKVTETIFIQRIVNQRGALRLRCKQRKERL